MPNTETLWKSEEEGSLGGLVKAEVGIRDLHGPTLIPSTVARASPHQILASPLTCFRSWLVSGFASTFVQAATTSHTHALCQSIAWWRHRLEWMIPTTGSCA